MDHRQNRGTRTGEGTAPQRLELSLPQVAGSALAAVAAAVFASKLGVYGTIIGAGVVSVIATCGGTVFQHLFRRTGDQIREVSVQVKPKARQVHDAQPPLAPASVRAGGSPQEASAQGEFGGATTYGRRVRGWKRPVVAAVVVFAVAMAAVTGYELAAGQDLSGGKGTTFSSVVRGGDTGRDSSPDRPAEPGDGGTAPSDEGTGTGTATDPGSSPGTGGTPTPAPTTPGDGQSPNAPESGGPSTPPAPGTSPPDGGSGGGDPADPEVQSPPPPTAPTARPSG